MNSELNALPLEYQGDYGAAGRNLDISDLVNNPAANGVCRVFGLGVAKQTLDFVLVELRSLFHDRPDAVLISKDTV